MDDYACNHKDAQQEVLNEDLGGHPEKWVASRCPSKFHATNQTLVLNPRKAPILALCFNLRAMSSGS